MFSLELGNADMATILALVACGVLTSAVAGALSDRGWRSAVRSDLELLRSLSEIAETDDEVRIASNLRSWIFRRVERNTGKGLTAGFGVLAVAAEYPFLLFFAVYLAAALIADAAGVVGANWFSVFVLGGICSAFDIFLRLTRWALGKRTDGKAGKREK